MRKNNFMNNREIPTTHTLMSGGIISIPDDMYQDFLHLYASEVASNNKKLTYSELRSKPVSRMYFDVDLLDDKALDEDFTVTMASTIQRVIRSYYTEQNGHTSNEDTFQCVVCTTSPKSVAKDGLELIKNGFHIIFPFLKIDLEKAYQLRFNVVYELERVMGKRNVPSNPWADALDKAPYSGGLKMCGSFKMVKCVHCKNFKKEKKEEEESLRKQIGDLRKKLFPKEKEEKFDYNDVSTLENEEFKDSLIAKLNGELLEVSAGTTCPHCFKGRHIEDRTYMPALVIDSDGSRNDDLVYSLSKDMYRTMKLTSIRCPKDEDATPGFKKPEGVPSCPDESNSANLRNVERSKIVKMGLTDRMELMSEGVFKSDQDGVFTWKGSQIFDAEKISIIEKYIRGSVPGPYSKIQVKTVFEHNIAKKETIGKNTSGTKAIKALIKSNNGDQQDDTDYYIEKSILVRVAGDGSTYCANKGGEHASNSIYFRITPQYCYQKCFSRKEEVRMGGKPCGHYRSQGFPIPYDVGRQIFSEEETPAPPTSSIAFSRVVTETPKRSNGSSCGQDECIKKAKVESIWGNRFLD